MIRLEGNSSDGKRLVVHFPEVHEHARTAIHFERTLRIPDDGKTYPLPAALGAFPLRLLEKFEGRLPSEWGYRGGVVMPLYQAEAMWIAFSGGDYPCAIKVGAGKINAISGKPWSEGLDGSEGDYIVAPPQRWLDGFCIGKDTVRQFVAMPLRSGYTAQEQVSGEAMPGGILFVVYPMKKDRYERLLAESEEGGDGAVFGVSGFNLLPPGGPDKELAPAAGGRVREYVYADPYGLDAWDLSAPRRCFLTLIDALRWYNLTGALPPNRPPTATEYEEAGLPWYKDYDADLKTLEGSPQLAGLRSVREIAADRGDHALVPDAEVDSSNVIDLGLVQPPRTRTPPAAGDWSLSGLFKLLIPRRG